jgi:hypothetical protein
VFFHLHITLESILSLTFKYSTGFISHLIFLFCLQEIAQLVFQIIDENLPRVKMTFLFGKTPVISDSRFHVEDLLLVKEKAVDIMLAAKDPGATLTINNVLILGIPLPAAQIEPEFPSGVNHREPGMHHSIVGILERDPIAFVVGNSRWKIGVHFMFGDHHVTFKSSFASHKVPAALNIAKDICGTLGFWDPGFQGSMIQPLQDPYYFEPIYTPPFFSHVSNSRRHRSHGFS